MKTKKQGASVKVLVTLSALAAIGIILGKFLAFNITEFMRFSLENITIIFSGILFGPMLGAVMGAVQDLIGCLAVGYAINPIITLGCASIGAISGTVFKLSKALGLPVRIAISTLSAHLIGSVIIKSIGLSVFYNLHLPITVAWRLLNYAIVGVAEVIILCILLKSKQLLSQINKITPFSIDYKFKTSKEAANYAKDISGVFSKPGLDRVKELLTAVGSPERSVRAVHITGTNGKGSTSAMLSSILNESGLKVGTFTSPYLIDMCESIRINGATVSEEKLTALFDILRPIADNAEDKPTEFELLTAVAYLAFKNEGVDVAVIECGMGARRDATNVIGSPLLSVITGISKDHTSYLGATLCEIAKEKAGVIKRGVPVLVGNVDGDALGVIEDEAKLLSAPIYTPDGTVIKSITLRGTTVDCGDITDVHVPLLGLHQVYNASLAISSAKLLNHHFPSITNDTIRAGILNTVWRGRFEILSDNPTFIFDGAHNLDGIKSAANSIKEYFPDGVICLTGVLADKEYEKMADIIATVARQVITITPDSPRALPCDEYARVFESRGVAVSTASSVADGIRLAIEYAKSESLPAVCLGSLYLYKDVIEAIKK